MFFARQPRSRSCDRVSVEADRPMSSRRDGDLRADDCRRTRSGRDGDGLVDGVRRGVGRRGRACRRAGPRRRWTCSLGDRRSTARAGARSWSARPAPMRDVARSVTTTAFDIAPTVGEVAGGRPGSALDSRRPTCSRCRGRSDVDRVVEADEPRHSGVGAQAAADHRPRDGGPLPSSPVALRPRPRSTCGTVGPDGMLTSPADPAGCTLVDQDVGSTRPIAAGDAPSLTQDPQSRGCA